MREIFNSLVLMLFLLNPMLVVIYLVDVMQKVDKTKFRRVLIRAGIIATFVFCFFAVMGDYFFQKIMQANFASFQVFGGIIFLLIAIQFVFKGPRAIELLRGESEDLAGAIAMPILVGPGTIGISVVIGERHSPVVSCGIIVTALFISIVTMIIFKSIHDFLLPRRERIIQSYIEVAGRITAMVVGTFSIEMIFSGFRAWMDK